MLVDVELLHRLIDVWCIEIGIGDLLYGIQDLFSCSLPTHETLEPALRLSHLFLHHNHPISCFHSPAKILCYALAQLFHETTMAFSSIAEGCVNHDHYDLIGDSKIVLFPALTWNF